MNARLLTLALLATAALLGATSSAHAWGAYHAGYTHVGPSGVQHYGYNAAAGPRGGYSGAHYSSTSGYRGGYESGAHYNTRSYQTYSVPHAGYTTGGYHYGGTTNAGVYRAW